MDRITAPASVIITGASRGIGREIALQFAEQTPFDLVLIARNRKALEDTRDRCLEWGNGRVVLASCDLSDPEAVRKIQVGDDMPLPAVLINNVGSYLFKPLSTTTYEEYQEQIHANLFTAVNATNRFLPNLKSYGNGLIINICSVGALQGLGESGAYASAKHALLGYSRSLREELMDTGIAVTAINLGQTESGSWDGTDADRQRLIDPKDVARMAVAISQMGTRTVVEEIMLQPQRGRVAPM